MARDPERPEQRIVVSRIEVELRPRRRGEGPGFPPLSHGVRVASENIEAKAAERADARDARTERVVVPGQRQRFELRDRGGVFGNHPLATVWISR